MINNFLVDDLDKYLPQGAIVNIDNKYNKIIGIETDLSIINENFKLIGRIVLIKNSEKLFLDMIVEFNINKIKWKGDKKNNGYSLCMIDPYWVKSYSPEPKINVPVKVRIDDQIVVEMRDLNFKQFQQTRLNEFYYNNKVPYSLVAAYKNFYKLNRPGKYYLAINATVKNYYVTQDQLTSVISRFNQEKNRIKNEWNKYLNNFIQNNESMKLFKKLYKNKNDQTNVIKFNKKGILS